MKQKLPIGISTFKEIREENYIYDKYNFTPYPVIKFSFGGVGSEELDDYAICFADLIEKCYEKYQQKVVV